MTTFGVAAHGGDPRRVGLILPGTSYTAREPLLAFASAVLRDAGWSLRTLVWDDAPTVDEATSVYSRVVRDVVGEAPGARHLVVGKSLGTLALPTCLSLGVPGAWLTPLISPHGVPEVRDAALALAGSGIPALLAGGTDDARWDHDVAERSGARVLEVPHADHALTVPGDWRASLAALEAVTTLVDELAVQVSGHAADDAPNHSVR